MKYLLLSIFILFFLVPCSGETIVIHRDLTQQEQQLEQIRVAQREKEFREWIKEVDRKNHELKLEEIKYKVLLEEKLLVAQQENSNTINIDVISGFNPYSGWYDARDNRDHSHYKQDRMPSRQEDHQKEMHRE